MTLLGHFRSVALLGFATILSLDCSYEPSVESTDVGQVQQETKRRRHRADGGSEPRATSTFGGTPLIDEYSDYDLAATSPLERDDMDEAFDQALQSIIEGRLSDGYEDGFGPNDVEDYDFSSGSGSGSGSGSSSGSSS